MTKEEYCRSEMAKKGDKIKCIYYGPKDGWNFTVLMASTKLLSKGESTLQEAWNQLADDINKGRI
jgi:hypothetical protein